MTITNIDTPTRTTSPARAENVAPMPLNFPARADGAHSEDGYVYIVEFSDQTIKVGRSAKPAARLNQHRHDGAKFGLKISQWWVSELHRGYEANEGELTRFSLNAGALQGGNEYFTGINFSDLKKFAEHLPIRLSTAEEVAACEKRSEEALRRWKEPIERVLQDTRHTIRVRGDSTSSILQTFFDPLADLPNLGGNLTVEQQAFLEHTASSLAKSVGGPSSEASEWSAYEYLCLILDSMVHSAKLNMQLRIRRESRYDLHEPWLTADEPIINTNSEESKS